MIHPIFIKDSLTQKLSYPLYISLHTDLPKTNQSEYEIKSTGYKRIKLPLNPESWVVKNNVIYNNIDIMFDSINIDETHKSKYEKTWMSINLKFLDISSIEADTLDLINKIQYIIKNKSKYEIVKYFAIGNYSKGPGQIYFSGKINGSGLSILPNTSPVFDVGALTIELT